MKQLACFAIILKVDFHISLHTSSTASSPAQWLVITRVKGLRLPNSKRLWRRRILAGLSDDSEDCEDFDFEETTNEAKERSWKPNQMVFGKSTVRTGILRR
jgi:hypothetical protein